MADLKRQPRWARFEPDFGDNLQLPPDERFYFEVQAGLTKEEMKATLERLAAETGAAPETPEGIAKAFAKAFEGLVQMGREPLTVEGKGVGSLEEYLRLCIELHADNGGFHLEELSATFRRINSFTGARALFYARPSGGGASTVRQSSASGSSRRAAPPSGASTSSSASSG
jgi:hypothetical protein